MDLFLTNMQILTSQDIKGESQFSVLPLTLSFARSRESKGCTNSRFDRGVGLRGRGRDPLKPSIFASLLETKGYPEHTAAIQRVPEHTAIIQRVP